MTEEHLTKKCTAVVEFSDHLGTVSGAEVPCRRNAYRRCLVEALRQGGYRVAVDQGSCQKTGEKPGDSDASAMNN